MKTVAAKSVSNDTQKRSHSGLNAAQIFYKKSLAAFTTRHPLIKPKLKIDRVSRLTLNQHNDKYEQEADRVADRVMRMPEPGIQRQSTCPDCKEKDEENENKLVQPKPISEQITLLVQRQEVIDDEEKNIPGEEEVPEKDEEEDEGDIVQPKLMDNGIVQRQEETGLEEEDQEKIPEEEDEDVPIRAKPVSNKTPTVTPGLQSQIQSMKGGGQPLPKSVRNYFEPRFGHDFSQVRVHTGNDAAKMNSELNAQAFTNGCDIYLGSDKYDPSTIKGKKLLAHELTHFIQQRGVVSRTRASTTPQPQIQLHRVQPDGQFAIALENFTNSEDIPKRAIMLLRKSRTFRKMVGILNKRYVSHSLSENYKVNEKGFITEKPFRNRRRIQICSTTASHNQTFFQPFGTIVEEIGTKLETDVIWISESEHNTIGGFIRAIAHEAGHAVEFVTGKSTAPRTIVAEIANVIKEERRVRKREYKVVRELIKTRMGRRYLQRPGVVPAIWKIERDFPKIGKKRTYLENAFFGAAWRRAITREKLDSKAIIKIDNKVDNLSISKGDESRFIADPDNFWINTIIPSRYGKLRYLARIIHYSWKNFLKSNPPGSQTFIEQKESILQKHARALQLVGRKYFGEEIAYTPKPSARPKARPMPQKRKTFWERLLSKRRKRNKEKGKGKK